MALRETPLHEIGPAALQRLIDHQERESIRLDYKRQLPSKKEDERREFLKDVSALANAEGGDLVYGVDEEDGVAKELVGVGDIQIDVDVPALLNLLRSSIEPRIPGIDHEVVELGGGRRVVIFRVPASVHAPHMVSFGNYKQFFIRNSAGSHSMSTSEVRQAVLKTAGWRERADAWRRERVALIQRHEGPCTLDQEMPLIVHVVPLQDAELDLAPEPVQRQLTSQCPRGWGGTNDRLTFDGLLMAPGSGISGQPTGTYTLWFHDGRAERAIARIRHDESSLHGPRIDFHLEEATRQLVAGLTSVGRAPPMLVLATLVAYRGMQVFNPARRIFGPLGPAPLDRDVLFLPPLLVEEPPSNWWVTLAPTINRIWQAFGHPRSPFSKEDGTRIDEWR